MEKINKSFSKSESRPKVLSEIPKKTLNQPSEIIDEYFESGFHSKFYILNSKLSSGVYFYRLSTPNYSQTKSMVLLK